MSDTSARLLRLLSLLQTPREWSGPQLADRLGVTVRTVRRDVDRLRGLGYPVDATRGMVGGYRLGAGAALPPLLLDDEEAIAVAIGLRAAATSAMAGVEESSLRALAKLEQVLPSRLRRRISALQAFTVTVRPDHPAPTVTAQALSDITAACRDRERLRFEYLAHDGAITQREAEPLRLVSWGRRWFLVAWDIDRDDWRTYRVDRLRLKIPNGPRFAPRPPPSDDLAAYVARGVSAAAWRQRARVIVHAPAALISERLPPAVGVIEALDDDRCVLLTGADTVETLATWIGMIGADFEVTDNPELAAALRVLADRYLRAAGNS
jgi:predicted DNA-binding transcriptional regulator YafY